MTKDLGPPTMRFPSLTIAVLLLAAPLLAEDGKYFPLNHRKPVGEAGRWMATIQPGLSQYVQPVRIQLPDEGTVTFYRGGASEAVTHPSPAQAGMQVGYAYRLKISDMPEHPGVELYPSIELLGRLHPPAELKDKYPVPIEITSEEILAAINDQMVTKVIYLEQPQLATPTRQLNGKMHTESLETTVNLLEAADKRGRPIAILRLGGRVPDPRSGEDEFFSSSPITLP